MGAAFELAGAGDDRDRQIVAEIDRTCRDNRCCRDVCVQGMRPSSSADHAGPRHARIPQKWVPVFATRRRAIQKTLAFSCQKMLGDQPCLTPEYQGCTIGYFTDENA